MKKILIIIFLIQCFCCFANKTKLYHGNMIFQCVKISDDSIEFIDFDLKETNQKNDVWNNVFSYKIENKDNINFLIIVIKQSIKWYFIINNFVSIIIF